MDVARRVGVIGVGRIARAVISAITAGQAGSWQLCGLLGRTPGTRDGLPIPVQGSIESFLSSGPDLILELGGPQVLRQYGVAALGVADTWTISGMALRDAAFTTALEEAGKKSGHRLRLLAGAIGGLDAIGAAAADPDARIMLCAGTVSGGSKPSFEGSALEAIEQFEGLNVVAAAAIAGAGLEHTRVLHAPRDDSGRLFTITAESLYGRFTITAAPHTTPEHGTRTVSASVIGALRQATRTIWAG